MLCKHCGYECDDEFDLCCDCFDDVEFGRMLRGDYGESERREARASIADYYHGLEGEAWARRNIRRTERSLIRLSNTDCPL